ncbi:MAG: tRNA-dihydrouridine synthase [Candidatus Pacebacteria bacterium]|nr:tRNA-dihydrouridine synthase [Candidatus Paceibacterota bacterium]
MSHFWKQLPSPFFALAPMSDVTDAPFRQLIAQYSRHGKPGGGPHVFWTEFVSADGLASRGREALKIDLQYTEQERPIVVQLFSSQPEKMREASRLCAELDFDGIDINMGCPDKSIEKQGCGAAMINTPEIAGQIIQAVKDGISDAGKKIPVSVKTRIGYSKIETETWIPFLLQQGIAALSVHARTRKQLSLVPADWSHIRRVVEIRDSMKVDTLIIGNGDVTSLQDGYQKAKETGCDGVMVGRAIFGNPWFFDEQRSSSHNAVFHIPILSYIVPKKIIRILVGNKRYSKSIVSVKERLRVLVEHCQLFESILGNVKSFSVMKKHFKAYTHGFKGAKELRISLMQCDSAGEVKKTIRVFISERT